LGRAPAPDETAILNFRRLLEEHELCGRMLDTVNHYLESRGIRITTGTIVDATIIHAPSSTKNENKERDPEMHQTKKGNQWRFAMKAHIGVDSKQGVAHSVCSTAASVSDVHMLPELLHGGETKVCHPTDEDLSAGTPVWAMRVIKDKAKRFTRPLCGRRT
jgi:IS5 family transposase